MLSLGRLDGAAEGRASTSDAGPVDISHMAQHGVQGRAVLVDFEAHLGTDPTIVGFREFAAVLKADEIVVEPGDLLVLHTGFAREVLRQNGHPTAESLKVCAALDGADPVFFTIPLFLSVSLGLSALETGARILPLSITLLAAAVGIPRFLPQASPRTVVLLGLLAMLAGIVVLLAAIDPSADARIVTVPLLLAGLGIGAIVSQLGAVTVSAVPDELSPETRGAVAPRGGRLRTPGGDVAPRARRAACRCGVRSG